MEMDQVLARFRDEYVTILGSNAKVLTPHDVYDAVTEVYKAQLKAFHLFGKALELKLTGHEDKKRKLVKDKMDEYHLKYRSPPSSNILLIKCQGWILLPLKRKSKISNNLSSLFIQCSNSKSLIQMTQRSSWNNFIKADMSLQPCS